MCKERFTFPAKQLLLPEILAITVDFLLGGINRRISVFTIAFALFVLFSNAQCPLNEADLADGGTFSGNCTVSVGLNVVITGNVIWQSGTLDITGSNGDIIIDGGSLDIQGGTINTNDDGNTSGNTDGSVIVKNGGSLTVGSGATLNVALYIQNGTSAGGDGGTITVDGTIFSDRGRLQLFDGATTINSGGLIDTQSNADNEVFAGATLDIYGTFQSNGDLAIIGGDVTVKNGGSVTVGDGVDDDLDITDGGSLTIDSGGTLTTTDDVHVGASDGSSGGSLVVNGTLTTTSGGDIIVYDTTPNSSLTGSTGSITADGTFIDNECSGGGYASGTEVYCHCSGGATSGCTSQLLPVELYYFTVTEGNRAFEVLISWGTAVEINNDYFVLYRSLDMETFYAIDTIRGVGNSNELKEYHMIDNIYPASAALYMLRQVDFDGAFEDLGTKYISINSSPLQDITIYPNPVSRGGLIRINGLEWSPGLSYTLYNGCGGVVQQSKITPDQMVNGILIDSTLSKGTYYLQFYGIYTQHNYHRIVIR